jgi:hypothetical protein
VEHARHSEQSRGCCHCISLPPTAHDMTCCAGQLDVDRAGARGRPRLVPPQQPSRPAAAVVRVRRAAVRGRRLAAAAGHRAAPPAARAEQRRRAAGAQPSPCLAPPFPPRTSPHLTSHSPPLPQRFPSFFPWLSSCAPRTP